MSDAPRPDYYRVLNVSADAPSETIHAAYRKLARAHHPDRNPSAGEASRFMALLNEAYGCLGDAASREAYDRSRGPSVPPAILGAVLRAAEAILLKTAWRSRRLGEAAWIFEDGARRVAVRLLPVLDPRELERWQRTPSRLPTDKAVQWSVILACRVRLPHLGAGEAGWGRTMVIDLTHAEALEHCSNPGDFELQARGINVGALGEIEKRAAVESGDRSGADAAPRQAS